MRTPAMENWPRTGALLFVGKSDTEIDPVQFAKTLLCQGHKEALPLIEAGSHPDFLIIEPEEKSAVIKIDQVRDLCDWAQAKPSLAQQKIAIIKAAECLNIQSANALLKTLEEPNPQHLFILITDHLHRIISTIRSRCFIVRHRTKEKRYGVQDLMTHEADNPLKIQVKNDLYNLREKRSQPVTLAQTWLKKDPNLLLYWMVVALCEETYVQAKSGCLPREKAWWNLMTQALLVKKALDDKAPFNVALMIETLLIEYARI